MKRYVTFKGGKIQHSTDVKLIYRFKMMAIKIPDTFFLDLDKLL